VQDLSRVKDWKRDLTPVQKEQLLERLRITPTPLRAEIFAPTRFDPQAYIRRRLGWEPWQGIGPEAPGQVEVLHAYTLALRQQLERDKYEKGLLSLEQLTCWKPGTVIKNRLRIEAGHTVGKTKIASGLVNHFFDHFPPAIIYTFAPTEAQIRLLLWKEIKFDREGKGLPGRILDTCEIKYKSNHFAIGRATSDASGKGTERVHGQHNAHTMFVLDEAEGVADFVYDAIDSMTSGGISIVVMLANPHTRTSRFHKAASGSNVQSFRMSCVDHPNVRADQEVVPGAVRRFYVEDMLEKHCEIVDVHNEDLYTFELPWHPDTIYQPDSEFLFRVLGIPPANLSDKCLIPVGRFEAACKRKPKEDRPERARLGLDVQRRGSDFGSLWARWNGMAWHMSSFQTEDTYAYSNRVKAKALGLAERGVTSLHIRIDAGGGFGGGIADRLIREEDLIKAFADFQVFEVHFGGAATKPDQFYDAITELTADVAETIKTLAIVKPPAALLEDLCEREYDWRNVSGKEVRKLEKKDDFRKRHSGRSPNDGDGFVLACASDFLFAHYPFTAALQGAGQKDKTEHVDALAILKGLVAEEEED
jgi:hypothetical protein